MTEPQRPREPNWHAKLIVGIAERKAKMKVKPQAELWQDLLGFGILWFSGTFTWFLLDSFRTPRGIWTLPPLDHPQTIYNIVARFEFIASAAFAAAGILVRRRKFRELSLADYIIVFACASVPVLCVFKMSEWIYS
jgi:hypothetical protein